MDSVRYFFIPKSDSADVNEDLLRIIAALSTNLAFEIDKNIDGEYELIVDGSKSQLFAEKNAKEARLVLSCLTNDNLIVYYLRNMALDMNYRVFNPSVGVFLPQDPTLLDLTTSFLKPKYKEIIKKMGLEPVFQMHQSMIVFAKDGEGAVHFVNPHLLAYLHDWGFDASVKEEFSYKVAPNVQRFVQYYDRRLVPANYYKYFKRTLKIINDSGIDVEDPKRKLFVKPYIMEIDDEETEFFKLDSERGKLLYMDKIRKGENLDQSLKRVLGELKVADDYIRAYVSGEVDYDRDKNDQIIPRLVTFVYVEKFLREPVEAKRGWESIDNVDV